jgi:hypothetical protein
LLLEWDAGDAGRGQQELAGKTPSGSNSIGDDSEDSNEREKKGELKSQENVDINEFLSYFYKELSEGFKSYPRIHRMAAITIERRINGRYPLCSGENES